MKEQLKLLGRLAKPGVKILDSHGVTVAPRYRMEIQAWPQLLELRKRMAEVEDRRWFPHLRKHYRQLKAELIMYTEAFLEDFLSEVAEKLNSGEYQIQEPKEEKNELRH